MSQSIWHLFRTWFRYAFYTWCVLIVLFPILIFAELLFDPSFGQPEFIDLPGGLAKQRLSDWPEGIDPGDVQAMSYKSEQSRDSYSSWYRIAIRANDAEKWISQIHSRQEQRSREYLGGQHEALEGVCRTITSPPPLHQQTGKTPIWWKPPNIDFRATEVMLWYKQYYSGVGRATYTSYDQEQGVLWIYDYACQHDVLWPHGEVPAGEVFTSTKK